MYFSHGQVLAYDQSEAEPGSLWNNQHVAQGFVRRDRALGIGTLIQHGNATIRVFLGQPASLQNYERAIAIPIVLGSGVLCIEGPEEYPIERSVQVPAGLYRLIAAQSHASDTELEIDMFLEALISPNVNSEILKADENLQIRGELLETGEVAP
jgi:hypothetical protein